MKKILLFGMMMLLIVSMVSAVPIQEQNQTHAQIREEIRLQIQEQEQALNSSIIGLERARLLVQNQIAKEAIEQNINRMQLQDREVLENMSENNNLTMVQSEDNKVIVQGRTQAQFLGFINSNREMTLVVDENGEVVRKGRPFDFLFRYQEQVRNFEVEA